MLKRLMDTVVLLGGKVKEHVANIIEHIRSLVGKGS